MQPGAGAHKSIEQLRRASCLHEAAGKSEVQGQGDLLDLVSLELQQFPCIFLELTFMNICTDVSLFGCCR